MDDSLLYTGHGPVQSKSMQYIDTQPFHFDVQPIQMPNMPDLTGLLYQQKEEPEQADKLSDFDKLMQRQFLMSSLTDNQPIQPESQVKIQPEPQVKQASDITELPSDSPYPYTPLGAEFDRELISILQSGKLEGLFNMDKVLVNESGQCGLRSLYVLAGAINSNEAKAELLSYEGPLGVGYGIMEFKGKETNLYDKLLKDLKESLKYLVRAV